MCRFQLGHDDGNLEALTFIFHVIGLLSACTLCFREEEADSAQASRHSLDVYCGRRISSTIDQTIKNPFFYNLIFDLTFLFLLFLPVLFLALIVQ